MSTFTKERLEKEQIAINRVKHVLESYGCHVFPLLIPEQLSLTEFENEKLKRALALLPSTKFDLLVSRLKPKPEYYLVEVKYKSRESWKNWVDSASYDTYFKIVSLPFPFLYFVYVAETDRIYRHEVTNPKDFERGYDSAGKPIYLIPESLIHEIDPNFAKSIDAWFTFKRVDDNLIARFYDYGLKRSSAYSYASSLIKFCRENNTTPEQLIKLPLEEIEDLTEQYIKRNRNRIAPKVLNVIYTSVKTWLHINRVIKSRKMFREIKFDRSSRKTRDVALPDKAFLRELCDNANLREKLIIALYGLYGLRPSLIGQLLLEDIYPKHIQFTETKITLGDAQKHAWIWVKREYEGNKGNIDFPIILTRETTEWLETYLNQRIKDGERLTPKSVLIKVGSERNVYRIMRKLFKKTHFKGRPYLLRHLANKLLKRAYDDYDLTEWLMGHKGKISAIYDHEHGLAEWEIKDYMAKMNESVLTIYGTPKTEEEIALKTIKTLIKSLDASTLERLKRELALGNVTFEQFKQHLDTPCILSDTEREG
jgi:integrase